MLLIHIGWYFSLNFKLSLPLNLVSIRLDWHNYNNYNNYNTAQQHLYRVALHLLESMLLVHLRMGGNIPLLSKNCCGFIFKFPCVGLVEVGRLGPWLNVPTQGQRVAQTENI